MSANLNHASTVEGRVPWPQLIAYGMGGLIPIALFNIAGQLIQLLGNISLGLSPIMLGFILMVPRLWDAVSDPLMGHITDNTRSRWGRRRPFILFGGFAVALSFVGMWWIPQGETIYNWFPTETAYNWFQLAFILVGVLIFFTACTVFEIPHGALGMEMSDDYHERTRLFSAKSFMGNLFAMGTPWLLYLAGLEFFRGPDGSLHDGMRYVSLFISAALIPMTIWWFYALREPRFEHVQLQQKTSFWHDMRNTLNNRTFLVLVSIIFTLATGFNFVAIFNYYITIFYLYGGDEIAAGKLLGINGTVWAVTGLLAVFPLNWIGKAIGKKRTLLIAILLMCAAQLSKIVCYDPQHPYLIIIPTMLLSAGMLMFFTLGSSMVGDICDEDELATGKRAEGRYYSVYWWFMKMGMAVASVVMAWLLDCTFFDGKQNELVGELNGSLAVIKTTLAEPRDGTTQETPDFEELKKQLAKAVEQSELLQSHLQQRVRQQTAINDHSTQLVDQLVQLKSQLDALQSQLDLQAADAASIADAVENLLDGIRPLRRQAPSTLFRLRLVEIGLPLLLSIVSIALTFYYPLTEARCYEIKNALQQRRAST